MTTLDESAAASGAAALRANADHLAESLSHPGAWERVQREAESQFPDDGDRVWATDGLEIRR